MKLNHLFISVLDVNEQLPFVIKKTKTLQQNFDLQEKAKEELNRFITFLEQQFKEDIFYIGMDVIGEKSYERFMFKGSGFFEVMIEAPVALVGHFPEKKRAEKFCSALKKTLEKFLPKGTSKEMFLDSITVMDEKDTSLKVEEWDKIKKIRKESKK